MVHLSDDDLAKPIPCAGWTVRDLIVRMNTEHAAIYGAPLNEATGPRTAFTVIAGEWLTFAAAAGNTINIPKMGTELPTDMVLATHFADMLVHRWDLATALGKTTGMDVEVYRDDLYPQRPVLHVPAVRPYCAVAACQPHPRAGAERGQRAVGTAPHLPASDRVPMPPWEAEGLRHYLPPDEGRNENGTAPVHPAVMSPLLTWAP